MIKKYEVPPPHPCSDAPCGREYKNWDIFHFSISKDIIMIYAYPHFCESVDFNYLVLENKKWFRADECFFN